MKQTVRIIGGRFRGKKLQFPDIEGLRPTPDRVRETLFNWLMHDIRGARCLDAFAGSGALGFEAFSRGADSVVFIEQAHAAFKALQQTALSFDSPHLQVIKTDACDYLQQTQVPFDLVFLDPPFAKDYWQKCIDILTHSSTLKENGLLYVESPEELMLDPTMWKKIKEKRAGQVHYALYQKGRNADD